MKRLITYHWRFQWDDYVMEQEIIECDNCYCLPGEITRFLRKKENSDKSAAKLWHCQIDKIEYLDEVWDKIKKMVMQEELSKYED